MSSTECSAFSPFSISKNNDLVGLYPFLQHVNDAITFDAELSAYINTTYVQSKYQTLFGCENITTTNTTDLYARYTTSIICNGIIQNSKDPCNLSATESRPVCADTCADQALSESVITSDSALCSNPSNYTDTQIRADFTNCALPADSLQNGDCVLGSANEPNNCGFGDSTLGLCSYCSRYKDDTCCTSSQAGSKCANVAIPTSISTISLPTATSSTQSGQASATTTLSGAAANRSSKSSSGGLSATTIGLIVVGSVVGLVLLGLVVFLACCLCRRRKRQNEAAFGAVHEKKAVESLSDLSSGTKTPSITQGPTSDYTVLPGGRIARKSTASKPPVMIPPPIRPDFTSEKPPSPSLRNSEYAVVPGDHIARTGIPVKAPPPVALPMLNAQPPWSNGPTANYPLERFPQLELDSITNASPVQTRSPSTREILQEQPVAATRPSPPSSVGGDFGYLLALLEKGGAGKSPASLKDDSTPSLSAADLKEFEVLPGGRLTRKHVPSTSTKPSPVLSRRSSLNRDLQPPPLSQSMASPALSRRSTLKKSQAPSRSQSKNVSKPSDAYETLPGGRIVRKKTALDSQSHNRGLKSTSKLLMAGSIGTGASAIDSAAKIRQSDEKSRRSTRSKALDLKDLKAADQEPKIQEQTSSASAVKSDDGVVASEKKSSQVTPQTKSQPSPASALSDGETEQATEDASEEDFQVASVPAVPFFRDPYSDSDEFALERGDMIEIVNIWSDGWATGRVSPDRVDAWESKHGILIETDLIEMGNGEGAELKQKVTNMVKAFPLVCVCAPRYWRKAIRDA
ncbi:hypothetical protein LOCC1_G005978 [Lachnellula occidentalis]|uniref:SH3 domain-containing protein n=1 Tax=Lachnellula occidentalis TaxID=215460 RepID=A0A8H8RUV3_9HELO|nr:hypothetical protein LOCC1_G005978 [Lachnellula occidentalis]